MTQRRGFAMILVMGLLAVMGTFGTALAVRQGRLHREAVRNELDEEAHWLAEAGLARARFELARNPLWEGCGPTALGEGTYEVRLVAGKAEARGTARRRGLACEVALEAKVAE